MFVVDGCDIGDDDDDDGSLSAPVSLDRLQRKKHTNTGSHGGNRVDEDEDEQEESNTGRLAECRRTLESVLAHPSTASIPLLVLANKQDREDCVETVRIKEGLVRRVFEGERGGGVRDSRVLPISALKGEGVREAVEWVRSRVRWNREGRGPVMR